MCGNIIPHKSSLLAIATALILAGCSENRDEPKGEVPEPPSPPVIEIAEDFPTGTGEEGTGQVKSTVPAMDVLGEFDSPVSGLALLAHPTIAYQSVVLAANGASGLVMVSVEGDVKGTRSGDFRHGVDMAWVADEAARTIIPVAAAWDSSKDQLQLFRIDPASGQFDEITPDNAPSGVSDISDICLVESRMAGRFQIAILHEEDTLTLVETGQLSNGSFDSFNMKELSLTDALTCSGTGKYEDILVQSPAGAVTLFSLAAEAPVAKAALPALPLATPAGLAVFTQSDTAPPLFLAMASNGSGQAELRVTDLQRQESPVLNLTVEGFDEIGEVIPAGAFAALPYNFGGLYREGVIAMVESEAPHRLVLLPWAEVSRQLGLPAGTYPLEQYLPYQDSLPKLVLPASLGPFLPAEDNSTR